MLLLTLKTSDIEIIKIIMIRSLLKNTQISKPNIRKIVKVNGSSMMSTSITMEAK